MNNNPIVALVTYADEKYKDLQDSLNIKAYKANMVIMPFNPEILSKDELFCKVNNDILSQKRGAGYWLWKPNIILEALDKLDYGDIVLYMDCGDDFINMNGMESDIINVMNDKDIMLTTGAFKHSDWCKKDCFVLMDCDTPNYHNLIQLEAGMGLFKKTTNTINFVTEWLRYAQNSKIITDEPNTYGDNYEGFKDHRHDQAILTNLWAKNPHISASNFLRKYINGNANNLK